MAENKQISGLTYEQLQELLTTVLASANKLNPLEEKQLKEEIQREERRKMLSIELGRAEEEARWRRQNSCTHCADSKTGEPVARGTGISTTSGQLHGDGSISLICMRCATHWHFMPTRDEFEYANNAGLLHFRPPAIERCLNRQDFIQRPAPKEAVAV